MTTTTTPTRTAGPILETPGAGLDRILQPAAVPLAGRRLAVTGMDLSNALAAAMATLLAGAALLLVSRRQTPAILGHPHEIRRLSGSLGAAGDPMTSGRSGGTRGGLDRVEWYDGGSCAASGYSAGAFGRWVGVPDVDG